MINGSLDTLEQGAVPSKTLSQALNDALAERPDWQAWVFDERSASIRDLDNGSRKFAAALLAHNVEPGDRVAIWLPNCFEWAVALYGCARIGAILVAMNTRWKAEEAYYVLQHSEAKLIFIDQGFLGIDFVGMLESMNGREFVNTSIKIVDLSGSSGEYYAWSDFVSVGESAETDHLPDRQNTQDPATAVLLQYTSGSISKPKGALLHHKQVLYYGREIISRLGVRPGEYYLNAQPLFHVAGSCLALSLPIVHGCGVVMPSYYSAGRALDLLERHRCVARGGTQAMYFDEMSHPEFQKKDLSALRSAWVGAAPEIMEKISKGYPIGQLIGGYAATEGGATFTSIKDPWEKRRNTVGQPLAGMTFRIRSMADGSEVPNSQDGEIGFRGWNQTLGYHKDVEQTEQSFDEQGFIYLGDRGLIDEDGYLHFLGRIKDMIKPGGENVSAEEVEMCLASDPRVKQVAVIGIPDDRLGEAVAAIVERESVGAVTEAELIEFCKSRISGFKVPKNIFFTNTWPLSASGKILKPELRQWISSGKLEKRKETV